MVFPQLKNKHLKEALFHPEDYMKYIKSKKLKNLPRKYMIIHQSSVLEHFKKKYSPKKVKLPIYLKIYKYGDVGVIPAMGIGSPHVVTVFDELINLGGKIFINFGTAGGLNDEGVFLCNKALRDEGTSHHYISHGRFSYPDKKLTE